MDNEKRKNEALERKRAYNREYHRRPEVRERRRVSHKAASHKYQAAHPENMVKKMRKYRLTRPEAAAATSAVNNGIRAGIIFKPGECSRCGETRRIEGHHFDYSRPMDVVWLCEPCHKQLHKENKNG